MFGSANSIRFIRVCSIAIMCIAATLSYGHQRQLLLDWGVDYLASAATPITIDLLAIICTLAIHTEGVASGGRRTAILVLLCAGGVSCSANFIAGGSLGSKITNVWAVVAYLLSEWVAAKVKAAPKPSVDLKRSVAAKKAAATRRANKAKRSTSRTMTQRRAMFKVGGTAVPDTVEELLR
jgi:hypothetical protein